MDGPDEGMSCQWPCHSDEYYLQLSFCRPTAAVTATQTEPAVLLVFEDPSLARGDEKPLAIVPLLVSAVCPIEHNADTH